MKSVLNVLCWKPGLDIPLDGVLVTIFVSHSFSCFNKPNVGTAISMATIKVSFDFIFISFEKKLLFLTFSKANKVFGFGDSQSKI